MEEDKAIKVDPGALSGIFAAPKWMRDLGFSAWLLVGAAAALVGAVWLLSLTQTIVLPVIVAGIVASVTVFLSFAALSLFFMLKDMPTIGAFVERHLGVPVPATIAVGDRGPR